MEKELFVESLNALKNQYEHDNKCCEAFSIILPDTHVGLYDNHFVNNQLLKVLQVVMNDNHKDSWIEYFCFEMDFGQKQKEDFGAYRLDGSRIDLGTPEALYDFLQELNKEKEVHGSVATEDEQRAEP